MIKRDYESYIILDGNFEDAQIEEIITKYEALFTKFNAEISDVERIGRRRMAYPIKKKQNGFYICFNVVAPAEIIAKVERAYRLDENIMRYLTIFMSKKELESKSKHLKKKLMMAEAAKVEAEKVEAEKVEAEKVEAEKVEAVRLEAESSTQITSTEGNIN